MTNAAAEVIRAAAKKLGVSTEDTIFIEHCGDFSYTGGRGGDETFARIRPVTSTQVAFQRDHPNGAQVVRWIDNVRPARIGVGQMTSVYLSMGLVQPEPRTEV